MSSKPPIFILISFGALALLAGCKDKEEIQVYRVSKDVDTPPPAGMGMQAPAGMPQMPAAPSSDVSAESALELTGTPSSNWVAQPPTAMRAASYLVKGDNGATADISLVALGGAAGGTLENVNRWLKQLGQDAITDEKLKQIAQTIPSPLGDVTVVDLEGLPPGADAAKDGRILAGIASGDGKTYFFKMRGNAALVESQKDGFMKWISSVHPSGAGESAAATSAAGAMPPAEAPANPHAGMEFPPAGAAANPHAGMGLPPAEAAANPHTAMEAPPADTEKPQIKWQVPDGWQSAPASSMRYATFTVTGPNGEPGQVAVSVFPGDTGGDLANVNRWRGQVGLDPVSEADLQTLVTKVKGAGGEFKLVDMAGQTSRLIAGWTGNNGSTWFFKLAGPDALVSAQKDKFIKFLESVQF